MKSLLLRVFTILVLASTLPWAIAQDSYKAEEVVPADSYAFASFCGLNAASESAEQLGLFKLFSMPEMQAVFEPLLRQLQTPGVEPSEEHGLLRLLRGPISLAITGMNLGGASFGRPQALLIVDAPGEHEALLSHLIGMLSMIGQVGDSKPGTYKGVPFQTLKLAYGGSEETIAVASLKNLWLVSWGQAALYKSISAATDKERKSLHQSEAFLRGRNHSPSLPTVEMYISVEKVLGLMKLGSFLIPDEIYAAMDQLGLLGLRTLHFLSSPHDGDTFSTWYIDYPLPRVGLLNLSGGQVLSEEIRSLISPTSLGFVAGRLDVNQALGLLSTAARAMPGNQGGSKEITRDLKRALSPLGHDILQELLPHLATETLVSIDMPENLSLPRVLVALELKDPAAFQSKLDDWINRLSLMHRAFTEGQHTLHMLVPANEIVPLSPCLAVHGKFLLASTTLSGLREGLARADAREASFSKGESIARAFKDVPHAEASGLHYFDTARIFRLGYEYLVDILPGLMVRAQTQFGIELNVEKLPPVEKVAPFLTPMAGAWVGDEHGLFTVSRSFGLATIAALGARGASTVQGVFDLILDSPPDRTKPR